MIKWIFTGCFIIMITFMAGGAGIVNEALGEEGHGGGEGSIYSIEENAVVINDMKYKFSSSAKFLSKEGVSIFNYFFIRPSSKFLCRRHGFIF